jgi:Domain of unknown function (DUF4328)/Protein of unknown function (DUF2510)
METNAGEPQWAADPFNRHQWRYWDGTRWTSHVADNGVQSVDVVDAIMPSSASPTTAGTQGAKEASAAVEPALDYPPPSPTAARIPGPAPGDAMRLGGPAWWRRLDGLKTTLVVLFSLTAAASFAVVGALANRLQVIDDIEHAAPFPTLSLVERADASDDTVATASGVWLVLVVATGIIFIIWLWRAAKNAQFLGRTSARFGPGWSIGGWFIPLANLVIPVLIVQDLWRATTPGTPPGSSWRGERGSALVGWWWALLILGGALSRATSASGTSLDDLRTQDQTALAGFVVTGGAAVLAIAVVVSLTRRFNEAFGRAAGT